MNNNLGLGLNIWFLLFMIYAASVKSCIAQDQIVYQLREIKQELRK